MIIIIIIIIITSELVEQVGGGGAEARVALIIIINNDNNNSNNSNSNKIITSELVGQVVGEGDAARVAIIIVTVMIIIVIKIKIVITIIYETKQRPCGAGRWWRRRGACARAPSAAPRASSGPQVRAAAVSVRTQEAIQYWSLILESVWRRLQYWSLSCTEAIQVLSESDIGACGGPIGRQVRATSQTADARIQTGKHPICEYTDVKSLLVCQQFACSI